MADTDNTAGGGARFVGQAYDFKDIYIPKITDKTLAHTVVRVC